ncbi:hypothetical protein J6590_035285 [Homalodisca vitripennis]|nr:hypothetical protein J6590_035285 [Homalodisca vitripennis]
MWVRPHQYTHCEERLISVLERPGDKEILMKDTEKGVSKSAALGWRICHEKTDEPLTSTYARHCSRAHVQCTLSNLRTAVARDYACAEHNAMRMCFMPSLRYNARPPDRCNITHKPSGTTALDSGCLTFFAGMDSYRHT